MPTDISHLLERLPKTEEKLGLELGSIYIEWDDGQLKCHGEVKISNEESVDYDFEIVIAVYDKKGRVIETEDKDFLEGNFYESDIFQFHFWRIENIPSKIRIFPRKT